MRIDDRLIEAMEECRRFERRAGAMLAILKEPAREIVMESWRDLERSAKDARRSLLKVSIEIGLEGGNGNGA